MLQLQVVKIDHPWPVEQNALGILFTLVHRHQIMLRWQAATKAMHESMQYLIEVDREQHAAAKKAIQALLRKKS